MKACPFCAEEIQDTAIKCRWCGEMLQGVGTEFVSPSPLAGIAPNIQQEQSEASGCYWLFVSAACVVLPILIFGVVAGNFADHPTAPVTNVDQVTSQFSAWDGSNRAMNQRIKDSMKNPDSFEHVQTAHVDKGGTIRIYTKFRGTNGFGGVVTQQAWADMASDGKIIEFGLISE